MKKPEEIKLGLSMYTPEEIKEILQQEWIVYSELKLFRSALAYIQKLEEEKAALLDALRMIDHDCAYCKHANNACEEADFMCSECKVLEQCPCYKCTSQDKHWEWCGLPDDAGGEAHGRS